MTLLQRLSGNKGLATMAVLGALALWVFVVNDGFRAGFLDKELSIDVQGLSEQLALAEDLDAVSVQVKAPNDLWTEFPKEEVEAFVDASGLTAGTHELPIELSVKNPRIIVLEREPEYISITLEPVIDVEKPIAVSVSGEAAEGFVTGDPTWLQDQVVVRGAARRVDRIDRVEARVEVQGESVEVRRIASLTPIDAAGVTVEGVGLSQSTVEVRVPIEPETTTGRIRIEPRTAGTVPEGFALSSISVTPSTVELEGVPDIVEALEVVGTSLIDLSGIRESIEREVSLDLPQDVAIRNNETITVRIEIEQQQGVKSVVVPLSVVDIPNGTDVASLSPSSIALTVSGSRLQLDALNASQIRVVTSLTGTEAGTYDWPIKEEDVQLPAGLTLSSVDTSSVRVILEEQDQ